MIEGVEAKRLTAEREAERRAELAREAVARPVRDMNEKLGKLERQTTELPAINVEKDRHCRDGRQRAAARRRPVQAA